MLNIINQKLNLSPELRKKINWAKNYSNIDITIEKGSLIRLEPTNIAYVEPHKVIINENKFLFFNGNDNFYINDLLKNCLPYYLFVMYFINRGQKICQTMFMNCDRSMLTYRFYREKTAILSLFKERLKTLIKLNVIPGFIMALGSVILLMTTGGASTTVYIITFLSIIAMSIFFSVHYLVLYYLLQPYDVNLDIKNPAFMSICGVTYFICYGASQVQIPTLEFGICMCLFTIIYSLLSLYLAYKYAPTRFKLRV